jgi:hypothetical protein
VKHEITQQDLDEVIERLNTLEDYLTERIVDCHNVKGLMQGRHAYILYRKILQEARENLFNGIDKASKRKTKK